MALQFYILGGGWQSTAYQVPVLLISAQWWWRRCQTGNMHLSASALRWAHKKAA